VLIAAIKTINRALTHAYV